MPTSQNTSPTSGTAYPSSLLAPSVSVADPVDGLLPKDVLNDDIRVQLFAWSDVREGDRYQLLWNNTLIGEEKAILKGEEPGDPLELVLPKECLTINGVYTLEYKCTRPFGGGTATSATTNIEVDRKPPAGVLLAALNFPQEIEGGLTSQELVQLGNRLVAEVPNYEDIKRGDVIQTRWGTQDGPSHTVTENEVPDGSGNADKTIIIFERSFLESLGDVKEPVTYTVTDRAGNTSIRSIAVTFQLCLAQH